VAELQEKDSVQLLEVFEPYLV